MWQRYLLLLYEEPTEHSSRLQRALDLWELYLLGSLSMTFLGESPYWLYKQGRTAQVEAEFERLLGVSEAKFAISELSKADKGDDNDSVKHSELL
ncbi:hypothetical protein RIF29_09965 [Crotalaria pallida]|uniref:Uncharacterized protein n=1 Tax=Crotalaria pallida TaxID=3830 RepID=A0AAN9IKN9_CROPI